MHRIAYFITSHGFGHAARASAVMEAVHDIAPSVSFDIFTTVPKWFFEDSVSHRFFYKKFFADIGLVQKTPFCHDIKETVAKLNRFIPFDATVVSNMADLLKRRACRLVVCDIAPIGISIAAEAGIPSVLVENFTWDWIYEDFMHTDAAMGHHVEFLRTIYQTVDCHIQTVPLCRPHRSALTVGPISRKIRKSSEQVRDALGLAKTATVVLLTTGGLQGEYPFLADLADEPTICFVIPGAGATHERRGNLILLPHRSEFFHPDLVNAADVVIGKAGYSTIVEVYQAGVPFGYVPRPNFREMEPLIAFIEQEIAGVRINAENFLAGKWIREVRQLLDFPCINRQGVNGSHQTAAMITNMLNETHA